MSEEFLFFGQIIAMEISEILTQLGEERASYMQSVAPPIFQSSNFTFKDVASMRASIQDEQNTPFYTRGCNPTVQILRKKVAALEGTEDALVFGSGTAAISAAIISSVKQGEHIVSVKDPYSWTNKMLTLFLPRFGISHTMVDGTDAENYRKACQDNTRLFILESPNSLTFKLQDIKAVSAIAKEKGVLTLLDNSYATPVYQKASDWGIDMIAHSASKYYGGHSDLVGGVLCGSKEKIASIFSSEFMNLGGIISPFDAWLMIRGLRTLPIRLERSKMVTEKVVAYLEEHPKVEKVHFPFSKQHPQYELAKKQMKAAQGLFSIELKIEDPQRVDAFCDALNHFLLACSWGGYESLVFPMTGLSDSENYQKAPAPQNLVRFYVGLEDPDLLIGDLKQALEQV